MPDDETQHPTGPRSPRKRTRQRTWMRWIASTTRHAEPDPHGDPTISEGFDVHATVRALPASLDGSTLPNGVVELLIEDFEAPTRQLFDIHDGHITLVEPGKCIPWASIAGLPTAWTRALGPERDASGLRLAGDEPLARRVLAAALSQGN